jgi:hypothetical protein
MIKKLLALTCLSLSVGANAAMVTTTYQATINQVSGDGNLAYLNTVVTVGITYDDAGTVMNVWNDGPDGIADGGVGDDTFRGSFSTSSPCCSSHSFLSDAEFSFSGAPTIVGAPRDAYEFNTSRASENSSGSISAALWADSFFFELYAPVSGDEGEFTFRYFTWDGSVESTEEYVSSGANLKFISTVSAVPIPAAAWLFGSALLGLGAIKRKRS